MAGLELVLILLAAVSAVQLLAERLSVPHPALLVLAGAALALVPGLPRPRLDPEAIFLVFVPPLLYWAAINTALRDLVRHRRPIALNAVPLVLLTMAVVAAVARALLPELPWSVAFVLGAIVSPPDPVAAGATLRRLRAPRAVIAILEGEGLVNDASALVAYQMAVAAVVTGSFSLPRALFGFLWKGAGGVAIGLAVGWAVALLRRRVTHPTFESAFSILTPFAAYIPADRLGCSGVLAVVALGLYVGRRTETMAAPPTRVQAQDVWSLVDFLLEGLVFILVGLELPAVLEALGGRIPARLLAATAGVTAAAILVRLAWVFPAAWLPARAARRPPPPWRRVAFVGWAGLRGGDSLVIALALPAATARGAPFPGRAEVVFVTFGVIFATLVLQGLTLAPALRVLRIPPDDEKRREEDLARHAVARAGLERLEGTRPDGAPEPEVLSELKRRQRHRIHRLAAREEGGTHARDEAWIAAYRRLRVETLDAERAEAVRLRDAGVISDEVMRAVERELDLEQMLLGGS